MAWAEEALRNGGYVLLGALILLENLFPPIPSEVLLPLAGSRVSAGELTYVGTVLAATIGSVAGALVLYAIGRFGGRPVLLRYGRILRLDEERLDRADAWFDRYGPWFVLFGRVIPVVRSVVSVPAGLSEMPIVRFTVLTTVGSAVWNAALIGAGWALGARWREVADVVDRFKYPLLAALVLVAVAWFVVWRRRRRAVAAAA